MRTISKFISETYIYINTIPGLNNSPNKLYIGGTHTLDRGHHDGCRMRSRKCLPFRSTWFHLWISCCLVICVSLFHVIVLSFGFWVFIVPLFDCLVSVIFTSDKSKHRNCMHKITLVYVRIEWDFWQWIYLIYYKMYCNRYCPLFSIILSAT